VVAILFAGLGAGALTTVAGLGGGQLLILALATFTSPHQALILSAPALLVGNLHRVSMLRAHLDRRSARAFSAGAIPGGVLGGFLASALPPLAIHIAMAAMTLFAIWRSFRPKRVNRVLQLPLWVLAATGVVIGALCATSSGAGLLLASLLLVLGLSGTAYVATAAVCAAALHTGRLAGYGLGGMLGSSSLLWSAALAVAIIAGNLVGDRLRQKIPARLEPWIEKGTLVACVVLVFVGAAYSR
jgi:hypothetical protein